MPTCSTGPAGLILEILTPSRRVPAFSSDHAPMDPSSELSPDVVEVGSRPGIVSCVISVGTDIADTVAFTSKGFVRSGSPVRGAVAGAGTYPAGIVSNSATSRTVPVDVFTFLSHGLYPLLLIFTVCAPLPSPKDDGVFPIKLPSTSISAFSGVDEMSRVAVAVAETEVTAGP